MRSRTFTTGAFVLMVLCYVLPALFIYWVEVLL